MQTAQQCFLSNGSADEGESRNSGERLTVNRMPVHRLLAHKPGKDGNFSHAQKWSSEQFCSRRQVASDCSNLVWPPHTAKDIQSCTRGSQICFACVLTELPPFEPRGCVWSKKPQIILVFINPRRACAARVTVVGLCVCLSFCLSVCLSVCRRLFSHYRLRGGLWAIPTASVLQGHEK